MGHADVLLSVRQLVTGFDPRAPRQPVDGVSFEVQRRAVLGLIGESGSGKTLTALSIMRLLPEGARTFAGEVWFAGRDVLGLPARELRALRGRQIAMTFQEPATALSPVHTVGGQLALALRGAPQFQTLGWLGRRRALRAAAAELLAKVELHDAEHLLDAHPRELSAGMRRRVVLALALAQRPALLIADEPTIGLDTPIQAQVIDLFARLAREGEMSVIFITHDLSALAEVASDVAVMYGGQIVECGPVSEVFARPQHPYTLGLLASSRRTAMARAASSGAARSEGTALPDTGCRYRLRCSVHRDTPEQYPRCASDAPSLEPSEARHRARCFYPRLSEGEDRTPA